MDTGKVDRCIEQLARDLCQSGTVAQTTRKRMLENLAKEDKNSTLQVRARGRNNCAPGLDSSTNWRNKAAHADVATSLPPKLTGFFTVRPNLLRLTVAACIPGHCRPERALPAAVGPHQCTVLAVTECS